MMNGHHKFFRCLAYSIELIILFILQNTPFLFPELLGARPFLVLPAVFSIALLEDELTGLGFGILGGLLMDFSIAGCTVGFNAVVLAILCFFIGLLAVNLIKTNLITALLATAAGVFIVIGLQFLFGFYLKGYEFPEYAFQQHYWPVMLYSYLFTPLLYYFNKAFAITIRERD